MEWLRVPIVTSAREGAGSAELKYYAENRECFLQLRFGASEFSAQGADYFDALCTVRLKLEEHGLLVAAYGGSRNLVLSGMCRDMGAGLEGYRVTLGSQPGLEDLVCIFDAGPDVEPSTVEEQRAFTREWRLSVLGGEEPGSECAWSGCSRPRIKSVAYCAKHLWSRD